MKIDMRNKKTFQRRVDEWFKKCFPDTAWTDGHERTCRFLEESLELAQSCGISEDEAHELVKYVFGRPVGDTQQEIGGTAVTLNALGNVLGHDLEFAQETELSRVWRKMDAIREKQANRPENSPLP